jgi:hypothetical protein
MFADPQSVTVNAVAKSLVKINQDGFSSEYLLRSSTDEFRFRIRNTSYRPKGSAVLFDRHNVELIQTVFATGSAPAYVRKAYAVFENQQGDTLTDPKYVALALAGFLTDANLTKLMNFES